jgi:membrane protease YdiL (CAAX protease family)
VTEEPASSAAVGDPSAANLVAGSLDGTTLPPLPVPLTAADLAQARRERIENEFIEVRRLLIFYGAVLLTVVVFHGWRHHHADSGLLPDVLASACLYGVIAGFAIAWKDEWIGWLRWPEQLTRGLVAAIVVTPIATILTASLSVAAAESVGWQIPDQTSELAEAGWPTWSFFVWIAVLPALFEEVAFRGLIFSKLQRLTSPVQAMWVSGILFGVVHFSVLSMAAFIIPLGVVAAYFTRRTQSLLPAMLIHAAHNAGMVILELSGVA